MQAWHPLTAPATTRHLRKAVGAFDIAELVEIAMAHDGLPIASADSGGSATDDSWEIL